MMKGASSNVAAVLAHAPTRPPARRTDRRASARAPASGRRRRPEAVALGQWGGEVELAALLPQRRAASRASGHRQIGRWNGAFGRHLVHAVGAVRERARQRRWRSRPSF